jgi:hypothetical protein
MVGCWLVPGQWTVIGLVLTPKGLASLSPGLLQPWVLTLKNFKRTLKEFARLFVIQFANPFRVTTISGGRWTQG